MIEGYRVLDAHVHMQPWEMLKPAILPVMTKGRSDTDELLALQKDPARFDRYLEPMGSTPRCA